MSPSSSLVFPAAAVDHHVDVRAIGAIGIAEHAQRSRFQVAAGLAHVREGVLANEVDVVRFVRGGSEIAGLRQHAGLQGQQVAEDARERQHHVDARMAERLGSGSRLAPAQPPEAVEARNGPQQRQGLGNRPALALEVVGAPQDKRHGLGKGLPLATWVLSSRSAWRAPSATRKGGGNAERVEAMQIAARGQDGGRADQVAAGNRADETRHRAHGAVRRSRDPRERSSSICRHVGLGIGFRDAGQHVARGPRPSSPRPPHGARAE